MFEISWSELLILAVVALIFIGPKDLPAFFNTLGRYAGMLRRQAAEFRQHFEDAMREAELEQIRKEVGDLGQQVKDEMNSATQMADNAVALAQRDVESAAAAPEATLAASDEVPAAEGARPKLGS
jgi:sec-independent protein translocase protein TatB